MLTESKSYAKANGFEHEEDASGYLWLFITSKSMFKNYV